MGTKGHDLDLDNVNSLFSLEAFKTRKFPGKLALD